MLVLSVGLSLLARAVQTYKLQAEKLHCRIGWVGWLRHVRSVRVFLEPEPFGHIHSSNSAAHVTSRAEFVIVFKYNLFLQVCKRVGAQDREEGEGNREIMNHCDSASSIHYTEIFRHN